MILKSKNTIWNKKKRKLTTILTKNITVYKVALYEILIKKKSAPRKLSRKQSTTSQSVSSTIELFLGSVYGSNNSNECITIFEQ